MNGNISRSTRRSFFVNPPAKSPNRRDSMPCFSKSGFLSFLARKKYSTHVISTVRPRPQKCEALPKPSRNENGIFDHISATMPSTKPTHSRTSSRFSGSRYAAIITPSSR